MSALMVACMLELLQESRNKQRRRETMTSTSQRTIKKVSNAEQSWKGIGNASTYRTYAEYGV